MNPALTSSKRLAVASSDLEEVRAHTGEVEHLVEFWLHDPDARTAAFEKAYLDSDMPHAACRMPGRRSTRRASGCSR